MTIKWRTHYYLPFQKPQNYWMFNPCEFIPIFKPSDKKRVFLSNIMM